MSDSGHSDNASSNIRCNMTTIEGVSPNAWKSIERKAFVNESANEIVEIPARGHKRDLKRSIMKGAVTTVEMQTLVATIEKRR